MWCLPTILMRASTSLSIGCIRARSRPFDGPRFRSTSVSTRLFHSRREPRLRASDQLHRRSSRSSGGVQQQAQTGFWRSFMMDIQHDRLNAVVPLPEDIRWHTAVDVVWGHASRQPDKLALVASSLDGTLKRLTYEELAGRARDVSAGLRE